MDSQFPQTLKMWLLEPRTQPRVTRAPVSAAVARTPKTFTDWSEEQQLDALRSGRPGAWLAFYDAFAPYVLSVLRRVLGPDRELEDLLQDVFARALEGIARVKDASKLKPWLRSLTVFTARETLRRRRWRSWLPLGEPDDDEGAIAWPTTTDALEARQLLRKVKRILDGLRVDDRLAFTLRHFEGLELTEVATTLGMSLSTAKRRIARAEAEFHRHAEADRDLRAHLATADVLGFSS